MGVAGDVAVDRTATSLEIRSATTGAITGTIATTTSNAGIATDGSYVFTADGTALRLWSSTGAMMTSFDAVYAGAAIYATPTELRAAQGSTVDILDIATKTKTSGTFSGAFLSWFDDGEHFLTTTGNIARVYTKAGVQVAIGSLPTVSQLTGQGNYVWTYQPFTVDNPLRIYAITDLSAPITTLNLGVEDVVVPAGDAIAHFSQGPGEIEYIQLGATITRSTITTLVGDIVAFARHGSRFMVGTTGGVVYDGAVANALSYGIPWQLSGASNGTVAIATTSGHLPILDVGANTVHDLPLRSTRLELSADGKTLVAADDLEGAQYRDDRSLRVVDLASGDVTYRWPYAWSQYPVLFLGFAYARAAGILVHDLRDVSGATMVADPWTDLAGNALSAYGPARTGDLELPMFSPDGMHAAFTSGRSSIGSASPQGNQTAQLYANGVVVGGVNGVVLAWLDNDRILVATYTIGPWEQSIQNIVSVFDATGAHLAAAALPDVAGEVLTSIGDNLVFSRNHNAIYDYTTGATFWQGNPRAANGVVVGDSIVYTIGTHVIRSAYR
jgi:hypothetical protein